MSTSGQNQFENIYATNCRLYWDDPIVILGLDDTIQFHRISDSKQTNNKDDGFRRSGYFKQAINNLPLITVITVVFNGERYLKQTIKSVLDQTYQNIEYILIDGGSRDKTLDIIRQNERMIDFWTSESDKGIADAMNKGLNLATGDYILFIHADDCLANSQSLEQAVGLLDGFDILMFDIIYGYQLKKLKPRGFNFWMNFKTGVYHQGVLCKREVFDQIGGFDTDFKIAMDYDFFLRAYRHGMKARKYPLVLSVMRDTGISSRKDWPALLSRFNEEKKVHAKNCTSQLMALIYNIYWPLYLKYRQILHRWKS